MLIFDYTTSRRVVDKNPDELPDSILVPDIRPGHKSELEPWVKKVTQLGVLSLEHLGSLPQIKTDLSIDASSAPEEEKSGTPAKSNSCATGKSKFPCKEFGGKELCIVVSYHKDGRHCLKTLAQILTHKARIEYKNYLDAETWRQLNYKSFKQHLSHLRQKAADNGWWNKIPRDYWQRYDPHGRRIRGKP